LCKASKFEHLPEGTESGRTIVFQPLGWGEFGIEVPVGSDLQKLRGSLEKKHSELQRHLEQTLRRLKNPDFVAKAGPDLRQEMEDRADNLAKQRDLLGSQLSLLEQAA
jgi:valyl-tRNA synthetase